MVCCLPGRYRRARLGAEVTRGTCGDREAGSDEPLLETGDGRALGADGEVGGAYCAGGEGGWNRRGENDS